MFKAKPVVIVPREEWQPDPPKATVPMVHPVKQVVITYDTQITVCENKEDCMTAMQVLQKRHMLLDNSDDIKYNFLVGGDGNVYEGRGFFSQPCKSLPYPEYEGSRLDIAFIGSYAGSEAVPPKLMIAAYDTAQMGIDKEYVQDFYSLIETKPPEEPPESTDDEESNT